MPKNAIGRESSTNVQYGNMGYFRLSDLPAGGTGVAAITAVTTNTTSADLALGARSVELHAAFSDTTVGCDILVYRIDAGPTPVLLATFLAVNSTNASNLFVGGFEGVDFQGKPVRITAQNFTGPGTGTVTIKAFRTS